MPDNLNVPRVDVVQVQHLAEQDVIVQEPLFGVDEAPIDFEEEVAPVDWDEFGEEEWEPPKILDEQIVEPDPGDGYQLRVRHIDYEDGNRVVELEERDIEEDFTTNSYTMSYGEALRLHKALGKVLENAQQNV